MSRLAAVAQALYYPTPAGLLPLLAAHLHTPDGGRLLDPCAGEGVALAELARLLGLSPFGNELDQQRAQTAAATVQAILPQIAARPPHDPHLSRLFHCPLQFMHYSPGGFNLLFLNPPYDHDAADSRLEYQFLRDTRPALQPGGLLVYLVPQRLLAHPETANYLSSWFEQVTVYRFPDDEYARFRQIALFAVRRPRPQPPDKQGLAQLRDIGLAGPDALPPLTAPDQARYRLPRLLVPSARLVCRPQQLDPAAIQAELAAYGVSADPAWQAQIAPPAAADAPLELLTPLRLGHLAGILSAGYLNHQLLRHPDGELIYLKGRTAKRAVSQVEENDLPDGGRQRVVKTTDSYQTTLYTLHPDGQTAAIDGPALRPFLERWIGPLSEAVLARYRPRYTFDLNGYGATLSRLNPGRRIPNTRLSGLIPAQQHAAAALATRLDPRHGDAKEAYLVGEMGVGKTLMGPAVAACLRARRILVLCPPHLVDKWGREIRHVLPAAQVAVVNTPGEVDAYFQLEATSERPAFALLKETSARAGSGWQHAYDWAGPVRQARGAGWGEFEGGMRPAAPEALHTSQPVTLTVGSRTFTVSAAAWRAYLLAHRRLRCPHCGAPQHDRNGLPASPALFGQQRRACENPLCRRRLARYYQAGKLPPETQAALTAATPERHRQGTPLNQFSRRLSPGDQPLSLPQALARHDALREIIRQGQPVPDTLPMPGLARWPLASYLHRRYRGQIDLLLADEWHQFKAADSDRGYAFGRLAAAGRKVLCLTGTLYGGRASTLFHLLYRTAHPMPRAYPHHGVAAWVARYGVLQEIETLRLDEHGLLSGQRRAQVRVKEMPGGSPDLLRWLLPRSVFLSLDDLGFALPAYREHPVVLPMSAPMQAMYDDLLRQLLAEIQQRLARGDKSLLAGYLQALLTWPDAPWRPRVVNDPHTGQVIAAVPGLDQPLGAAPKERAILELIQRELAQQRRVLLLCQQTETLDITPQWRAYLQQHAIRAAVLKCDPAQRERWIAEQEAAGVQVILSHPKRIETGLDILGYPTVIWLGQEFSVFTVRQACRRPYRIGQTQPVHVYFFAYEHTLQEQALLLIAAKLAAAIRLDGDDIAEDSLADLDELTSGDIVTTLAKIVTGELSLQERSLQHAFQSANQELRQALTYLGPAPAPVILDELPAAADPPTNGRQPLPAAGPSTLPGPAPVIPPANGRALPAATQPDAPALADIPVPTNPPRTLFDLLRQHAG